MEPIYDRNTAAIHYTIYQRIKKELTMQQMFLEGRKETQTL
jgi:hypothetical protein